MTQKPNVYEALVYLQAERKRGTLNPDLAAALDRLESVVEEVTELLTAETNRIAFSSARRRREAERLEERSSVFAPTDRGSRPAH